MALVVLAELVKQRATAFKARYFATYTGSYLGQNHLEPQSLRMSFSSFLRYFDDVDSILAYNVVEELPKNADCHLYCMVFCGDQIDLVNRHLAADCKVP